ncbi:MULTISPECIES: response regulator transcription factor [unclassified Streptomyces]|uniref:helix-turn-helix transcriptional regulator n=1 Tax=unclassified Streptomyces TaxID=2593676 RepID=UPI003793F1F3
MDVVRDRLDPDMRDSEELVEHAARLEQALLQARALIESTVSMHRERLVFPSSVALTQRAQLDDVLEQVVGQGRFSIAIALTGIGQFTDSVIGLLGRHRCRATVRVLCTGEVAKASADRLRRLVGLGIEVRVSENELRGIVVVDAAAALVYPHGQEVGGRLAMVNDAAAVRAIELLFAGTWAAGRELVEHLGLSPRLRTDLARDILERLRAGHTDETAAREINVSLRTYRRHVAEIMRELDAHSRFQAGVRAVEFGLLSA